jgi:hypothetical protein
MCLFSHNGVLLNIALIQSSSYLVSTSFFLATVIWYTCGGMITFIVAGIQSSCTLTKIIFLIEDSCPPAAFKDWLDLGQHNNLCLTIDILLNCK